MEDKFLVCFIPFFKYYKRQKSKFNLVFEFNCPFCKTPTVLFALSDSAIIFIIQSTFFDISIIIFGLFRKMRGLGPDVVSVVWPTGV